MLPYVDASQAWAQLLQRAFDLIDAAESEIGQRINWTLGGGTVLMFRFNHRLSKDIDVFFDDAQLLGLFNPRLHDRLDAFADDYDTSAQAIKLRADQGDIDFILAAKLTESPDESEELLGRSVELQSSAEIVARKLWHRGDQATARDLMDLALVATSDPALSSRIRNALTKSGAAFVHQCRSRRHILQLEFDAIDSLDFDMDYDECLTVVDELVRAANLSGL